MTKNIDISKIDVDTLELMKEASKSRKEYVIPLILTDDTISAYDIIEGHKNFAHVPDPRLIPNIVALFHNHPPEIKPIISVQDIIISSKFNIPFIIGGKKEIILFDPKPDNTFKDDLDLLISTQDKVLENLALGKLIDEELKIRFRGYYEKTISNFDIIPIYIEKK